MMSATLFSYALPDIKIFSKLAVLELLQAASYQIKTFSTWKVYRNYLEVCICCKLNDSEGLV